MPSPQIFTRTQHIHDQALELYILNELSAPDTADVEQHVAHCGQCHYNLQDVRKFVTVLRHG